MVLQRQTICMQGPRHSSQSGKRALTAIADCISSQDVCAVLSALKAQNTRLAHHVDATVYRSLEVRPVLLCSVSPMTRVAFTPAP